MKLSNPVKILLVIICFAISVAGFLIRLPSVFSHYDKQLHSLFYFLAAGFLNILFTNKKILRHAIIFISLYSFGVCIEYAQEYSNKLLHKKIHGRYDVEDIHANLRGLIAFSILWLLFAAISFLYNQAKSKTD